MTSTGYQAVSFDSVPGWTTDDVGRAAVPFCECLSALSADLDADPQNSLIKKLETLCRRASALVRGSATDQQLRAFFEQNFIPHRVMHEYADGLLTGYYEPVLNGSRTRSERYCWPIYRRPADLVDLTGDVMRGASGVQLTHAKGQPDGTIEPYMVRSEIEQGGLAGQDLELLYLEDPVDAFFLHVQGSGEIALDDGGCIRVGYDGKNGHPYTSVGRFLIESKIMTRDEVTLETLAAWLREEPERGRQAMWRNQSFIFFKELGAAADTRACGVKDIPLTTDRSLAVDASHHQIGLPVFVASPKLTHVAGAEDGFHRLMVAQDVGSAITGPERGDIFFGSGDGAGRLAGITKHRGNFFVLLPRDYPV